MQDTFKPMEDAPPQLMESVFQLQRSTALAWRQSSAAERIARLQRLRQCILEERDALYLAFEKDFRKPRVEVDATEIIPVLEEIQHNCSQLKRWMRPHNVGRTLLTLTESASVHYQPKGRCLIIAPWNYPFFLLMGPLVSALAAGNTAILKPSELTPAVNAVMRHIVENTFRPNEVALFEGGLATSQALLAKPFDHIFFTGSPTVGKLVMEAASKHLASVTLELGGKSPTVVDASADLRRAAETLLWGKFINNGQTCVAPDYVYVHQSVKDEFIKHCVDVLELRYGDSPQAQQATHDLTRVISDRHTARLAGLLAHAVDSGARVLAGGQVDADDRFIAPTLLDHVPPSTALMQEEIFGPILPIIAYSTLGTVIDAINAQPKPLALYVWSQCKETVDALLTQTSSGGVCINHCVLHVAHGKLPFGGVNNSGIGSAHGIFGFKAFSHERAVLRGGWLNPIQLFFPPYTGWKKTLLGWAVKWFGR
ncbi:aldehyde dehydrogenase family protein [Curvibacter sp. CHRR-16]|uniref:aldehyde dehydrogenase family protein n=1 Tax=Curvibacter sp. CHRR-16 TaxID=2835872 RepID=UPI002023ADD2|nr:aldehyde dehydrogenase family protein [Curvibacter sp. CHRR-16]